MGSTINTPTHTTNVNIFTEIVVNEAPKEWRLFWISQEKKKKNNATYNFSIKIVRLILFILNDSYFANTNTTKDS